MFFFMAVKKFYPTKLYIWYTDIMSFQNITTLLNSPTQDDIVKALMVLYNNPRTEFEEKVTSLSGNSNPLVRSLSEKVLKKISILKSKLNQVESGLELDKNFNKLNTDKKLKILTALKLGHAKISVSIDLAIDLFFKENNSKLLYSFAETLAKISPSEVLSNIRQIINSNSKHRDKALLILVCMKKTEYLTEIIEEYKKSRNEAFLIAASLFLWTHSKIVVVSVIKELAESTQTPMRIIASLICKILKANELKGIIVHLTEDMNEAIKNNAKAALLNLKQADVEFIEITPPSEDIYSKFREVLVYGTDFQDKLSVMKVIDNLGRTDFLDIISDKLSSEENPFLISAYVKYLGKYGKDDYFDQIVPHIDHSDARVVANCIEGLGYCSGGEVREIMLKFIKHKHHRIASCAAVILWKSREQGIVHKFLQIASDSKKLWKRKSALHILEKIHDEALDPYVDTLKKDKNNEIRESIKSLLLRRQKDTSAKTEVIDHILSTGKMPENLIQDKLKILQDNNSELEEKIKAAKLLSFMATSEQNESLKMIFYNPDVNIRVRLELLTTLSLLEKDPLIFLVDNTRNEDAQIRVLCLEHLRNHDCSNWIDDLFPLLYDENQDVVSKASVLLNDHVPEKVGKKIRTMVCSPEPEMKLSALSAIHNIGTKELFDLATYLIQDPSTEIIVRASSVISDLQDKFGYKISKRETETHNEKIETEKVEKPVENPIEILRSVSSITDPKVIEDRINTMIESIKEQHLPSILSFMETTTNTVLLSKLTVIFGLFSTNQKIIAAAEKCLDHPDQRVVSNTIESLATAKKPVLFEKIFQKIPDASDRIRVAIMKLIFTNPEYSQKVLSDFIEDDYEKFVLSIAPKELMNKYSKSANVQSEITEKVKKITKKSESKPKKKPVKKTVIKKKIAAPNPLQSIIKNPAIQKMIAGGVLLLVLFFVSNMMFTSSQIDEDTVEDDIAMPNVTPTVKKSKPLVKKAPVKKIKKTRPKKKKYKLDIIFPKDPENFDLAVRCWEKINSKSYSVKKRQYAYLKLIKLIEKKYFRGEFFLVKKDIESKKFDIAKTHFLEALENIENDQALWDPTKGIWIERQDMEDKILQEVKKTQ
ncbi:hypothetical protein KAJ27_05750, partial [bacterium]|nr:hypothetical protein [bacterium]